MSDREVRTTVDRIWLQMLDLMSTVTQQTNQIRWLTIATLMLGGASVLISLFLFILVVVFLARV